jgi:MFS family permease
VVTVTGSGRHPRLGADFARLWIANAISNLGDGVTGVAGPLLVASLTGNPALVAGAVFVQQLPWLLFALPVGAYVDRLDRQRLLVAVNLARAAVLASLAAAVWTDLASLPVLYTAFFLFGAGETLADSASVAPLGRHGPAPRPQQPPRPLRAEIAEGLGWLWPQRTLRLLAVRLGIMNLAGAGTFAIWVLWAADDSGPRRPATVPW